jgi:hypothetical protein
MTTRQRTIDYLSALCIVIAFGGLFFGRLLIYPVSTAPGDFLQRVAARSDAWDVGHRWMLVGMIGAIPAAIGLRRALHPRTPWLADTATVLTIFGAALGVGQYALDFAMLAAARIEPQQAGAQFLKALQADSFVQYAFYKFPDFSQLGLLLFAIALWLQGASWRVQAALVSLAAATSLVGPLLVGAVGVRVALGLWFLGFSTVAWKIAVQPPLPIASTS